MGQIITTFSLNIWRMIKNLEGNLKIQNSNNKANILSLLVLIKKDMKTYKSDEWENSNENGQSLSTIFTAYSNFFTSDFEKLSFFLIISDHKDLIKDYNLPYFCCITDALIEAEVNPYNYSIYAKLFLDKTVYRHIGRYGIEYTTMLMTNLIEMTSLDEIRIGAFDRILKRFCAMAKITYSPVFDGDFNYPNTYCSLLDIMESANKDVPTFKEDDFDTLQLIKRFRFNLPFEAYLKLTEQMSKIETECGGDDVLACKRILNYLKIEYARINGIARVMMPIKKQKSN